MQALCLFLASIRPRELGGAADLISQFKLWPHYESFCKKSIPLSISETRYLHNVVGDTEIRKGEGMELDQLFRNASHSRERNTHMHLFDLDILGDAFRMRETTSVNLCFAEKGIPTSGPKLKSELKEEERKRKRLKSKVKKDKKDHKKHSEQQKDKSSHMEKCRDFSRGSTLESLKKPWDNVCTFAPLVALLKVSLMVLKVFRFVGVKEAW
ncbi:hypothetical protein TIFTF001_050206 [Ficus carica]|uniref:Uncharacterized protein n=1 Tax=Ficus carica TaxID=3494 RepID=A0AA88CLL6_FICCA|nr:hypothetical protein TIFTF001_050206 [Ficus carica]